MWVECGGKGKVSISTAKADCIVNVMRTAAEWNEC